MISVAFTRRSITTTVRLAGLYLFEPDSDPAASETGDFATEQNIYLEYAVLDYPQSRERIVGRHNIQISRTLQPNKKRFVIHRIVGSGGLWITEYVLAHYSHPYYAVSIMELRGLRVAHETQYLAAPFEAGESRRIWVVNMDSHVTQADARNS
jgi:hypothetical protein